MFIFHAYLLSCIPFQLVTKESQLEEIQINLENTSRTRTASMMSESGVEERIQEFTDQAPLLESLQRELSSAQDTINALTNQNSLLRTQAVRDTDGNDNLRDNSAAHVRIIHWLLWQVKFWTEGFCDWLSYSNLHCHLETLTLRLYWTANVKPHKVKC